MAQHILPRAPTTAKLHTALKQKFGAIPVGVSSIPRVNNTATGLLASPPYVILYPLWSTLSGPAWGQDRHADAEWCYQISMFGGAADNQP